MDIRECSRLINIKNYIFLKFRADNYKFLKEYIRIKLNIIFI